MDLWQREARLFKYGSGTGTNFSKLRGEGEPLSGGGRSSGLMSFLKIGDRAAGAIKSGGTTRRAAKMVTLDIDHPDIEDYIDWKVVEEQKVAALVAGSKACEKHLGRVIAACAPDAANGGVGAAGGGAGGAEEADRFDPKRNRALRKAVVGAREAAIPESYIQRVIQFARQGFTAIDFRIYDTDWDSEAYRTVAGQNSNNSVRLTDEFLRTVEAGRRLGAHAAHGRRGCEDRVRAPPDGQSGPCRLGLGGPRRPVRHDRQRLAHLPGGRADRTPRTRARNTCSWTTRPATWRRST